MTSDSNGVPEGIRIMPVAGLPEFRPGDDLAGAIAAAAPWLADGDVVVVTSKVLSKVEGRLVRAPAEPRAREDARLAAVRAEAESVPAVRGSTWIVRTRHGLVLAAAGVDASNVAPDEIALLPVDPDASAAALRSALGALLGIVAMLALLGLSAVKKGAPPVPEQAIAEAKLTTEAIRGQ